jgi:hypothetical protein
VVLMPVGYGDLLGNSVIDHEQARPDDMVIIRHVVQKPSMHLLCPILIVNQAIRSEAFIDDGDVIAKVG